MGTLNRLRPHDHNTSFCQLIRTALPIPCWLVSEMLQLHHIFYTPLSDHGFHLKPNTNKLVLKSFHEQLLCCSRSLRTLAVTLYLNVLPFCNTKAFILPHQLMTALFQEFTVAVQGLHTRFFLNKLSKYHGNLPLEFVLLLARTVQFLLRLCTLSFCPSDVLNDRVTCRNGLSAGATLSSGSLSWTALLLAPPHQTLIHRYLPLSSTIPLAQLGVLPFNPAQSPDVATVCSKPTLY